MANNIISGSKQKTGIKNKDDKEFMRMLSDLDEKLSKLDEQLKDTRLEINNVFWHLISNQKLRILTTL